jgi:hypothetical protein
MSLKVFVARNYASKSREAFKSKWVNKNRDTKNGREDPNNITRNNRDASRDSSNIRGSNGNDIEAKRNEASIIRHFFYRSETKELILIL